MSSMYAASKGGRGGGGHQSIGGTGLRRGGNKRPGRKTLHTGGRSAVRARDKGERDGNKGAKEIEAERTRQRAADMLAWRRQRQAEGNAFDEAFGFPSPYVGGGEGGGNGEPPRVGWLINMLPTTTRTAADPNTELAAVDLYFLQQDGITFKATVLHRPYFYLQIPDSLLKDAMNMLERRLEGQCDSIEIVEKVDLDLADHLSGKHGTYIKISFSNVQELMAVRKQILPVVQRNKERLSRPGGAGAGGGSHSGGTSSGNGFGIMGATASMTTSGAGASTGGGAGNSKTVAELPDDVLECIIDIREYDVPYTTRVAIDLELRCGAWYRTSSFSTTEVFGGVKCEPLKDMLVKAEPRVLAFDIECTKAPLKFPDAEHDQVFMISYMFDGQGYLIINREVVSEDIEDFEYTPKPQYPGPFHVFNEVDEAALLRRFFDHCQELRPNIWVTFNGDFFDWPFLDKRAAKHNMVMEKEIGVAEINAQRSSGKGGKGKSNGEYRGRCSVHMDAFAWVNRDSYLPMGSRGLKAVTKYKLGYDPVEVNPEEMVRFASERPQHMAAYSVSDAVATYYLYMKYVHNFIFSLATIIPMGPEDVLRKGSGTLCEMLLMVEAVEKNIICPNKQSGKKDSWYNNRLLQNETYVGGHVECLESGVFRDDIPTKFTLDPTAFDELIENVDRDLTFYLEVENGVQRSDCTNYDTVRNKIIEELEMLRDVPMRDEEPVVYHLDVAAMYPNIILTNRLQPTACAAGHACPTCEYHLEYDAVHRRMPWTWRGDMWPATRSEVNAIRNQVEHEFAMQRAAERAFEQSAAGRARKAQERLERQQKNDGWNKGPSRDELKEAEIKRRLKDYCQKVYKKTKVTVEEERVACVCQRENPFYVDTVRAFRDRRYEYKKLTKKWGKKLKACQKCGDAIAALDAKNKSILYDSLQLAHKCILNSFYGYVMRRGARWYSMPMAAVVTRTGAMLITQARELVERVGRPLELDTDGIWCILPSSFPENYRLEMKDGSKINMSYPCAMLNADVHKNYTNHQYQTLVDKRTLSYATHSECSIYFEVDGPYRCMVLPASQEKDRLLKKRYAVFNFDGSLAELKGFELKRRGELSIIKVFQSQVFEKFLDGESLEGCYAAVGKVADEWLDVLHSHGDALEDEELIELISENRSMSRQLEDYGNAKSTAITVARRLGDLLGMDQVKDKGLNCKLIICRKPSGRPVTERAIPVAIFESEPAVMRHYLRKWLKDPNMTEENGDFDIRNLIDWDYYVTRLNSCIQKIITIPAALQRIPNPVPRCEHPDWLRKVVREKLDPFKQKRISDMFGGILPAGHRNVLKDYEGRSSASQGAALVSADANADKDAKAMELEEESTNTFDGWLKNRKRLWKSRRLRRKRLNGGGSSKSGISSNSSLSTEQRKLDEEERARALKGGMGSYIRANAEALSMGSHHWQVLEIRQQQEGMFRIFALTSPGVMQHFDVVVPRTLYTNSRLPMDALESSDYFQSRLVARTLPRGHRQHYLYELNIPESRFKRNEKSLSNLLTHPDLEGVYELGVPLEMRAVLNLGCVVKVMNDVAKQRRRNKKKFKNQPFALKDLEFLTTAKYEYLDPSNLAHAYRRAYMFHSETVDGRRGAVGLFIVEPTTRANTQHLAPDDPGRMNVPYTASAHVWLADSGRTSNHPNLARIWKEYTGGIANIDFPKCTFTLGHVQTPAAALAAASSKLSDLIRDTRAGGGPTVAQVESSLDQHELLLRVPVLHEIPIVPMRANSSDSAYPALSWQRFATQRMLQRFLVANGWWEDRLDYARYAHIPVGNFGSDVPAFVADVFFSRTLQRQDHLLWMSRTSLPDLGHGEGMSSGGAGRSLTASSLLLGHSSNVKVLAPGAYRSICVELDVFNLAVNTILEVQRLAELEGADGQDPMELDGYAASSSASERIDGEGGFGTGESSHVGQPEDEGSNSPAGAFRVLRMLVQNWFVDVIKKDNPFADQLLVHFYRWVCSSSSLLHEPAIRGMLHRLMGKVFVRLVEEFRRLGCVIVFADFNHLIISTNQRSLEAATGYMDYVVNTVQSNPLFSRITLQATKYWSSLLFMDRVNYCGVMLHEVDHSRVAQTSDHEGTNIIEQQAHQNNVEIARAVQGSNAALATEAAMNANISAKLPIKDSPAPQNAVLAQLDGSDDSDDELGMDEAENDASAVNPNELMDEDMNGNLEGFIVNDDAVEYDDGDSDEEMINSDDDEAERKRKKRSHRRRQRKAKKPSSEGNNMERSLNEMLSRRIVERHRDEDAEIARARMKEQQLKLERERHANMGGVNIDSHWNLLDYLPEVCRDPFEAIVGKFVFKPLRWRMKYAAYLVKRREQERKEEDGLLPSDKDEHGGDNNDTGAYELHRNAFQVASSKEKGSAASGTGLDAAAMAELKEAEDTYVRDDLISKQITHQLYDNLRTIQRHHHNDIFPEGPGSHLSTLSNPALEFVKAITKVLSLDYDVCGESVALLKRNLLRMLAIPEFDMTATWEDPCRSFILPDVICSHCNYCRDLDLCRDPLLIHNRSDEWPCPQCHNSYDKDNIEMKLVQIIEGRSAAYQSQDLRCPDTGQVQAAVMTDYCPESSKRYKCDVSPFAVRRDLNTFLNIARYHHFVWLEEVTQELLQIMPEEEEEEEAAQENVEVDALKGQKRQGDRVQMDQEEARMQMEWA